MHLCLATFSHVLSTLQVFFPFRLWLHLLLITWLHMKILRGRILSLHMQQNISQDVARNLQADLPKNFVVEIGTKAILHPGIISYDSVFKSAVLHS